VNTWGCAALIKQHYTHQQTALLHLKPRPIELLVTHLCLKRVKGLSVSRRPPQAAKDSEDVEIDPRADAVRWWAGMGVARKLGVHRSLSKAITITTT